MKGRFFFRKDMFSRSCKCGSSELSFGSVRLSKGSKTAFSPRLIVEVACKGECRHHRYIKVRMMFWYETLSTAVVVLFGRFVLEMFAAYSSYIESALITLYLTRRF